MFSIRITAVILCLFSTLGYSQGPQQLNIAKVKEPATITVYLTGNGRAGFKTFVDGILVERLDTHHQVSFLVVPGYHEVKMEFGKVTPIRAMHLDPGQQVYLAAEFERPSLGQIYGHAQHKRLSPHSNACE
jgi:hypothetical protein